MAKRSTKKKKQTKPRFFRSASELRQWLEKNHETANELQAGYYKKHSPKYNYSWPETVDEALCFGWIDGIRHRLDDDRYTIRFTPRRPKSVWSETNTKRFAELKKLKLVYSAGIAAFADRNVKASKQRVENKKIEELAGEYEKLLRKNKKAWSYFQSQPPSVRKNVIQWIMRAKKPETRLRRINVLIEDYKNQQQPAVISLRKKKK